MTSLATFKLLNVADTCSLWNVLASPFLYRKSKTAGVSLSSTQFVEYECLHKRGSNSAEWNELRKRLRERISAGEVMFCSIELEDLQEVATLEDRLAISKGELSSIAWAKRTGQGFFSDDKKAKSLATSVLAPDSIQDTPHLCAWLCIHEHDEAQIRADLKSLNRFLDPHISNGFRSALEFRLMVEMEKQRNS